MLFQPLQTAIGIVVDQVAPMCGSSSVVFPLPGGFIQYTDVCNFIAMAAHARYQRVQGNTPISIHSNQPPFHGRVMLGLQPSLAEQKEVSQHQPSSHWSFKAHVPFAPLRAF